MTDLLRLDRLIVEDTRTEDGTLIITVRSKAPTFPRCCLLADMRHVTKRNGKHRDFPIQGQPVKLKMRRQTVFIEIDRQRYKCKECGRPMYEGLPDIDTRHDMTKKLLRRIQKDAVEWPFNQAAQVNGVDAKQVERIFKDYAAKKLKGYVPTMPRVLGMDEKYIQKKARFIIGDIERGYMLDMQPSRKVLDLNRYFGAMPGRNHVEVVCQDMWKDYRGITKKLFPNAVTVIDKYHVQRTSNRGVEAIRRLFQGDISKSERIHLKNKQKVFLARWETAKPFTRNQLTALFTFFPELKHAYEWKEAYYEIYDATSKAEASERMDQWLRDLPPAYRRPFKPSIDAINNWRPWILNYWDHLQTNAYVESLNNLIGRMNMQGVGYDLETLRAKALLKHGRIGEEIRLGITREGHGHGALRTRKLILGVPLSTLEADLAAGTF